MWPSYRSTFSPLLVLSLLCYVMHSLNVIVEVSVFEWDFSSSCSLGDDSPYPSSYFAANSMHYRFSPLRPPHETVFNDFYIAFRCTGEHPRVPSILSFFSPEDEAYEMSFDACTTNSLLASVFELEYSSTIFRIRCLDEVESLSVLSRLEDDRTSPSVPPTSLLLTVPMNVSNADASVTSFVRSLTLQALPLASWTLASLPLNQISTFRCVGWVPFTFGRILETNSTCSSLSDFNSSDCHGLPSSGLVHAVPFISEVYSSEYQTLLGPRFQPSCFGFLEYGISLTHYGMNNKDNNGVPQIFSSSSQMDYGFVGLILMDGSRLFAFPVAKCFRMIRYDENWSRDWIGYFVRSESVVVGQFWQPGEDSLKTCYEGSRFPDLVEVYRKSASNWPILGDSSFALPSGSVVVGDTLLTLRNDVGDPRNADGTFLAQFGTIPPSELASRFRGLVSPSSFNCSDSLPPFDVFQNDEPVLITLVESSATGNAQCLDYLPFSASDYPTSVEFSCFSTDLLSTVTFYPEWPNCDSRQAMYPELSLDLRECFADAETNLTGWHVGCFQSFARRTGYDCLVEDGWCGSPYGICSGITGKCACSAAVTGNRCSVPVAAQGLDTAIVIGVSVGASFSLLAVLVIGGIIATVILVVVLKNRKKISAFRELEDIDTILSELSADKENIARIDFDPSLFQIDYSDLDIKRVLGSGGSGSTVYLAQWQGRAVAAKCFRVAQVCDDASSLAEFEKELELMGSMSHNNLLSFFGASVRAPMISLVMEFCIHGDVKNYMQSTLDEATGLCNVPLDIRIDFLVQIARGLSYLHSKHVVHRDMKNQNVLVDENLTCKIMDFGLSKVMTQQSMTAAIGTGAYMAPEICLGLDYDEKIDIFSFGIMMFEIVSANFKPYEDGDLVEMRVASNPHFRPSFHDVPCAPWLRTLARSCWAAEPTIRPSADEIIETLTSTKSRSLIVYFALWTGFEGNCIDTAIDTVLEDFTMSGLRVAASQVLGIEVLSDQHTRFFIANERDWLGKEIRIDLEVKELLIEDEMVVYVSQMNLEEELGRLKNEIDRIQEKIQN